MLGGLKKSTAATEQQILKNARRTVFPPSFVFVRCFEEFCLFQGHWSKRVMLS